MSKTFTTNSLFELKSVAAPTMNQHGIVVYVETLMRQEENDYLSQLWSYSINNQKTKQWTFSTKGSNFAPLWSPDGDKLAFLSSRDEKSQIYLFDKPGGEPIKLTDFSQGVTSFIWDETGENIYFNARVKDLGKEEDVFAYGPDSDGMQPLVIDNMIYRWDTVGYIDPNSHLQIFVLNLETKVIEQLTNGLADHKLSSVYTNALLFSRDAEPQNEFDFNKKVYLLNIGTKEIVNLPIPFESCDLSEAYFSPSGKKIAVIGHETIHGTYNPTIYLYDVKAKTFTDIWGHTDKFVGDCAVGDFKQKATTATLQWAKDSESVYFKASHDGMVILYQLYLNGDIKIIDQSGHLFDFALQGDYVVSAISNPVTPNNIYLTNIKTQEKEQISFANEQFLTDYQFSNYKSFTFQTSDDHTVHGFLVLPKDFDREQSYPLIYNIHGGPHAMHTATFFHEVQLMSAKGYAVLLVNPRGSYGYGYAHTDAIRGRLGDVDYQDFMEALDYIEKTYAWIDNSRLHVMGGSYGGYMTNWMVAHSNRFCSAAAQRSVTNWTTIIGTSDIGYFADDYELNNTIFAFKERFKISPMAYVHKIDTPLLLMQSEEDYRCPMEQAEQLYIYLKYLKKTTRLIRFPKSSHELSRSGYPSLRAKRLEAIFEWFEKYPKK